VHNSNDPGPHAPALGWSAVITVLAGLTAGWIAAGAVGLMGHPLRHTLTFLAAAIAALAGRPTETGSTRTWVTLLGGVVIAVAMSASSLIPINVLAVAVLLAALAVCRSGPDRQAVLTAALAVAALGVYRLALTIGTFWTLTDRIGRAMGQVAGGLAGRPLWVGATFGGLDFLVVMGVFLAGWILLVRSPGLANIITAAVVILVGHVAYLVALSFAPEIKAYLAEPIVAPAVTSALPPPDAGKTWTLTSTLRNAVPWNFPLLAALIHLTIAGAILRWSPRSSPKSAEAPRQGFAPAIWVACLALAVILPTVTTLSLDSCSLEGKKIVANEKGFLNWLKPEQGQYGRLAIGMYGMMKPYFESMGAEFSRSEDLSDKDLDGADLLILIYPNEPWEKGQLERILKYVEDGGSLLVLGEHTTQDDKGDSRFNEVLGKTDMRVRFDSGTFAVGGWLHSYQTVGHPTTAGIDDARNRFGSVIGASMAADWPSVPLLVGRWGWADPGEMGGPAMMGNHEYDPGEKLGDLVLGAEQPCGNGRIIAFGDTSGFTNGITIGAHIYTSRLYGYLASKASSPQVLWRQCLGLLLAAGMVFLLIWRRDPLQIAAVAIVLAASLAVCTGATYRAAQVLPDGLPDGCGRTRNNLAYIDSTHMEAYSPESWRPDGMMGMNQTLMRQGYLTLNLPEFTRERIERAGIVVSVAPSREFSASERAIVRDFVNDGGIFICTVGYDERGPTRSLLNDFGFKVGLRKIAPDDPEPEPQPMSHFKVPYVQSSDRRRSAYVRYHASWPVANTARDPEKRIPGTKLFETRVIANGRGTHAGQDLPVIMFRRVGKGKFVVIGDTCFVMNKNLERKDGRPVEGMRENADFWRWFLEALLTDPDPPKWNPLAPTTAPAKVPTTAPARVPTTAPATAPAPGVVVRKEGDR